MHCAVQYMHIPDRERCNWLRERIETAEEVRPKTEPLWATTLHVEAIHTPLVDFLFTFSFLLLVC